MEVCNPKGGRTATPAFLAMLLMMMIMMLLNAYCCGASLLVKSNTSFRCSDGRLDECSLIKEDLELEFLMNPYVSRILGVLQESNSGPNSNDPHKPACGQHQDTKAYTTCISKQDPKLTQCVHNDVFKRCDLKSKG